MNQILSQINRKIHAEGRIEPPVPPCSVWRRGGFLHLSFSSTGCRFHKQGYCIMCDYGHGETMSVDQVTPLLEQIWAQYGDGVSELLLGSCGSILDEVEIPVSVFNRILHFVETHPVPTVIFETHYSTVTKEKLLLLKTKLSGAVEDIVIELGMESANEEILKNSLNKFMSLNDLEEKMRLIQSFGMSAVVNVFLGAPFLSPAQQMEDALNAIKWACSHGANNVVLFPANIKENTLLKYLYKRGRYALPSAWLLIETLRRIPVEMAEKVQLSWYGDRQDVGMATNIIAPRDCEQCHDRLQQLFTAYTQAQNRQEKTMLMDKFCSQPEICGCHAQTLRELESPPLDQERELQILEKEFGLSKGDGKI